MPQPQIRAIRGSTNNKIPALAFADFECDVMSDIRRMWEGGGYTTTGLSPSGDKVAEK